MSATPVDKGGCCRRSNPNGLPHLPYSSLPRLSIAWRHLGGEGSKLKFGEVRRGRPRVGGSVAIHLRVSENLADAIDTYIGEHLPEANRQEAVRDLVRLQLTAFGLLPDNDSVQEAVSQPVGQPKGAC